MSTNDDTRRQTPGTTQRATVAPESEARGGPEAPQESLDTRPEPQADRLPGVNPDPGLGSRAALPEGTLPGPYLDTQGDENRKPPDNAPAPVNPTATVTTTGRGDAQETEDLGRAGNGTPTGSR